MEEIAVYVKTDDLGRIVDVNSGVHLVYKGGWTEIDRGEGPRYSHAQSHYFDQRIRDDRGVCRYKLEGGRPVLRTQAEMDADAVPPARTPTDAERIALLEEQNAMLTECVLEMSAMLYA